jgi:hypothetical protein
MEAIALFVKQPTFSIYKMNITPIKEAPGAFCCPCHVNILINKVVRLLVKTPKNLYDKRKKYVC